MGIVCVEINLRRRNHEPTRRTCRCPPLLPQLSLEPILLHRIDGFPIHLALLRVLVLIPRLVLVRSIPLCLPLGRALAPWDGQLIGTVVKNLLLLLPAQTKPMHLQGNVIVYFVAPGSPVGRRHLGERDGARLFGLLRSCRLASVSRSWQRVRPVRTVRPPSRTTRGASGASLCARASSAAAPPTATPPHWALPVHRRRPIAVIVGT